MTTAVLARRGALNGDCRKSLALELKAEGNGQVRAVFATFGVVDLDGDVVLRGAFTDGQKVLMAAAHDWSVPGWIGTGTISTTDTEAVFEGEFFSEADGQSAYTKIKEADARGVKIEWSWGFQIPTGAAKYDDETYGEPVRILGLKPLKVAEVSPVVWGAGIDTRTVGVKNTNVPLADHYERVLLEVKEFGSRMRDLNELRQKDGRVLSAANRERLETVRDAIQALLDETDPSHDDGKAMTQQECEDSGGTWDSDSGMCEMPKTSSSVQSIARTAEIDLILRRLAAA